MIIVLLESINFCLQWDYIIIKVSNLLTKFLIILNLLLKLFICLCLLVFRLTELLCYTWNKFILFVSNLLSSSSFEAIDFSSSSFIASISLSFLEIDSSRAVLTANLCGENVRHSCNCRPNCCCCNMCYKFEITNEFSTLAEKKSSRGWKWSLTYNQKIACFLPSSRISRTY